jgi:hypothetical protein
MGRSGPDAHAILFASPVFFLKLAAVSGCSFETDLDQCSPRAGE